MNSRQRRQLREYCIGAAMGIAVAFILALAFYDLDIFSVWLVALAVPGARLYSGYARDKRSEQTLTAFRDALSYVKNGLDAGDSAENAFAAAILPLKKLYGEDGYMTEAFSGICRKVRNGMPLETAIAEFAGESEVSDIIDFSEVFPVLKRTGGDMNVFISREIKSISDKQGLMREINTVTAGKRNEFYIMSIIPTAMILYLRLTSGAMLKPLYHNPKGIMIMTLLVLLYGACILGGQWILKRHLG